MAFVRSSHTFGYTFYREASQRHFEFVSLQPLWATLYFKGNNEPTVVLFTVCCNPESSTKIINTA